MNEKPKGIIYCRVSAKSQQDDGSGLDSQELRCRQHAAAKGHQVIAVFPDTITGGGDFMKRPGMVALLSFLDAQPDERFVVIFDDLKRFARDTRFHLDLREAFRKRGAQIECLNFKFDETPEGEFIETIMAAQGALERKQNGRQVAQKMKARMQSGYWTHSAPIGYKYQAVRGRGKMLVLDEPLATIVRDAFEGYAMGRFQTQAEVRRFFESFPEFPRNRKGVITQQRVVDILTQSLYTGYICSETYDISWLKGHHDPLITVETFEKVQARRDGVAYAPSRKNVGDDFALRGMAECADCGVPLRSSWSKGRGKLYAYYLCQTKTCESYGKSIPRDKLEDDIGAVIRTLQPTQNLFTIAKAMFAVAWEQRASQAAEIIRSGQRQIDEVEKQIETLLSRVMEASNATVIRSYENKITELERSKIVFAGQLANQATPKGKFEDQLEPALTFLANPWKLWQTGHIGVRRTVLKLAFQDRIQYCRKQGPRTPKIALPFKAIDALTDYAVRNGAPCRCASIQSSQHVRSFLDYPSFHVIVTLFKIVSRAKIRMKTVVAVLTLSASILVTSPTFAMDKCSGGNRAERKVTCVVDGDTGWEHGVKWRMLDIDTPEVDHAECTAERAKGNEATRRLATLMAGGYRIEDSGRRDRNGRILAHVILHDERNAGEVLIIEGLAQRWPNTGNIWCGR